MQDFPKIATFLPGRTVQEVVRLYYAIQVRGSALLCLPPLYAALSCAAQPRGWLG